MTKVSVRSKQYELSRCYSFFTSLFAEVLSKGNEQTSFRIPLNGFSILIPPGGSLLCRGQGACVPQCPGELCRWGLAGSPMPDRWKGRDQKKSDPLTLQVGGWTLD